jgi:hypothetical protein
MTKVRAEQVMNKSIAAIIGATAVAVFAGGASAQSNSRWIDPARTWSIDFASSGWGQADGMGPDGPLLLIAPAAAPRDEEIRICFAEQSESPNAEDTDLAQLNASGAGRLFPRAQLREPRVAQLDVGGHVVAAVQGMSRDNEFRARAFITRSGGRVFMTTISCIMTPGMNPARAAEVDAILQSLQFASVDASTRQGEWLEPSGRYALGFRSLGWTAAPNAAHAPNILAFVRNDSPRDDRMRICFVRHDAVPYSEGFTQATANEILDRWDETRLSQVVGSPVTHMTHARVGDVSAIDYRLLVADLDGMFRFFMVPGSSGMDQITISCGFPAPLTDEEVASINAVFNTLRILPREAK